jgi:hypothetical protein
MEDLEIKGQLSTFFTPSVSFSAKTGICEISGESYLEDSFDFYDTLIRWLNDYFKAGASSVEMNFRLSYYNTAASRCILDILRTLRNQYDTGKKITINWYYPDPDYDEMKAEAEDYMEEIGLPINLISYKQT